MTGIVNVSPEEAQRVFEQSSSPIDIDAPNGMSDFYDRIVSVEQAKVVTAAKDELKRQTELSDDTVQNLADTFAKQFRKELEENSSALRNASTNGRRNQVMSAIIGGVASVLAEAGIKFAGQLAVDIFSIIVAAL